jgi:hypothetical protein
LRVSGYNNLYQFILGAGAKAKTLSDWRSQAGVTTVQAESANWRRRLGLFTLLTVL